MMEVEYRSNNSGGSWWLGDKDWQALEDAGWFVYWGNRIHCQDPNDKWYSLMKRPKDWVNKCEDLKKCQGHRVREKLADVTSEDKFLGAAAHYATLQCETPTEAIRSFEKATGLDASDEGCNCCGAPHSFTWGDTEKGTYGSAYGEECLAYLFPDKKVPKTLREALEE